MPTLLVENGPEKGRRVELKAGERACLGRDKTCELSVADHLCSRRHFEVQEGGSGWIVRDLGSSNGTFVNDERIKGDRPLKDGDSVQAGDTRLVFQADAAAAEPGAGKGLAGKSVGGYRILERLGRGAMGTVYKANQTSLNRVVALKILSPRISADPAFVAQFQREAQAAGRLNHPNIVHVYDVGQDQGLHFYSMEYIENGTVEDLFRKQGRLDAELALAVVLDAAKGLVYAAKNGIVHRDIKPANLMINGEGVVKIADLGLAHDTGQDFRDGEPVFGTPHYISPEQAQGRPVDSRSDLYSLGATAYFLIAGATPFSGENVHEIVRAQIEDEPEALAARRPDVPPRLAAVVARLMKKDPAERYPTAADLVTALEAVDAGGRGGKRKAALVAAACVVILGGAFAAWKLNSGETPAPAPPTTGETPESAAEKAAAQRLEVQRAAADRARRNADASGVLADARMFDGDQRRATTPDLAAVRSRYQDVIDRFEGTEAANAAEESVLALTKQIETLAEEAAAASRKAESRAAEVAALLEPLRAAAKAKIAAEAFGELLVHLSDVERRHSDRPEIVEAAKGFVDEAARGARDGGVAVQQEATKLEVAGDFPGAAKLLDDAADRFAGAVSSPATAPIDDAVVALRAAATATKSRGAERSRAERAVDSVAAFRARQDAARLLLRSADLAAAARLLQVAVAAMTTAEYRTSTLNDAAAVEAALRVRTAWVDSIKALPAGSKIRLPAAGDRKRLQEVVPTSVDASGIVAKRGSADVRFEWKDLPLADAYDLLFKDVAEKSDALRPDIFETMLLVGRADRAVELVEGLPESLRTEFAARAAREAEGWRLLAEVRDLAVKARTDDALAGKLLRATNRLLDEFADTRACLVSRRDPPPRR